jgi:hypothetical protein
MNKRKAVIGGVIVLMFGLAAWCFGFFGGADPALAKLHELGGQMADKSLTDAQRKELRGQFREQMQTLSDDQRHAFFQANRGDWEARQAQRMDEFFAMSKADQQKRLDEILNRMAQAQSQSGQPNGSSQLANGGNSGRANGAKQRGSMTEEQREERSKRRLDNTNPKQRAQFSQFRKMLDQRALQRGISPPGRGARGA